MSPLGYDVSFVSVTLLNASVLSSSAGHLKEYQISDHGVYIYGVHMTTVSLNI